MKANKALKRLNKIESIMSDVAKRFSAHTPDLGGAFDDLKATFRRVKEAVEAQASSLTAKKKASRSGTRKADKARAGGTKAAAKKTGAKVPAAKTAKRRAPDTKAAKTARVPKKAASASAGHESTTAPASEME
jgi:hypothetical protein